MVIPGPARGAADTRPDLVATPFRANAQPPATPVRPGARARRRSAAGRHVLTALAAVLLAVSAGTVGAVVALRYQGTMTAMSAAPAVPRSGTSPAQQIARVAAAVLPSIVSITVSTPGSTGEGSGVILRSDGTIVTNNHVIEAAAGNAGVIRVLFANGKSAAAVIVGQDAAADIAVIRAQGVSGLTIADLGSAASLHVGDTVLAIGSPLGLSGTVTSGIVSALHRKITVSAGDNPALEGSGQLGQAGVVLDVIQTDTAINPGNSGGALVDVSGRVVGITTAIASVGGGYVGQQSGSIGVGFAVPADTAYQIAVSLLKEGASR